jgi:hypothetical protein
MKSSPISLDEDKIFRIANPGRTMDHFIFGDRDWLSSDQPRTQNKVSYEGMSSLQRAMLKLKIQNDPNEINIDDDCDNQSFEPASKDEDGVIVFQEKVLRSLIG